MENQLNVLGTQLQLRCSHTGYTRKGFCYVPTSDAGNHSVCAIMTDEFLQFSGLMATAASITGSFTALVRDDGGDGGGEDDFDPCTSTFTALFTNDDFPSAAFGCGDD